MRKKIPTYRFIVICGIIAGLLSGCSLGGEGNTPLETEISETAKGIVVQESDGTEEQNEATEQIGMIGQVAELLGMQDSETVTLLGGGEENWTEDHSFYIGRIFQPEIDGKSYPVYTSCGEDGTVESVSLWIVSGERLVKDYEAEEWEKRVSEYMETDSVKKSEISEGGSQNWVWRSGDTVARLSCMEDNLTLSFQKAIGEMK